jgi:hypothetical protein
MGSFFRGMVSPCGGNLQETTMDGEISIEPSLAMTIPGKATTDSDQGEKVKYKGVITECISGEKITMKFSFPLSLITEKIEMIVEDHDSHSTFKHITYMKFKFLSRTIFKKQNLRMLNDMDAHVTTEGGI